MHSNWKGSQTLILTGSNLPTNLETILVGTQVVEVVSSNETTMIIYVNSMAPGLYDVIIPVNSLGNVR